MNEMNEMVEPEPAKAEPAKPNIVPSEGWLRKHRERMSCARPVVSGDAKQGEKPLVAVKPKEAGDEGDGKSLGIGDKPLGLGDGWGW